ncbi:MAG TPA: hypothetical protein VJ180_15290, partial [Pyrinomonadaceae bacterium]|nr:hypothetical protein [Pyrinomonadaceae bacterium]
LNPSAPQRFKASIESGAKHLTFSSNTKTAGEESVSHTSKNLRLPLRIPFRALAPGRAELRLQLTLFYCREDNTGTCRIRTLAWNAAVEIVNEAGAPNEIKVQATVEGE